MQDEFTPYFNIILSSCKKKKISGPHKTVFPSNINISKRRIWRVQKYSGALGPLKISGTHKNVPYIILNYGALPKCVCKHVKRKTHYTGYKYICYTMHYSDFVGSHVCIQNKSSVKFLYCNLSVTASKYVRHVQFWHFYLRPAA